MTIRTELLLNDLANRINARLDAIHATTIAKFRTLARSIGQRTRVWRIGGSQ